MVDLSSFMVVMTVEITRYLLTFSRGLNEDMLTAGYCRMYIPYHFPHIIYTVYILSKVISTREKVRWTGVTNQIEPLHSVLSSSDSGHKRVLRGLSSADTTVGQENCFRNIHGGGRYSC